MEELFEQYWRGTLSTKDKEEFQIRLSNDQTFAAAYHDFVLAAEASRRLAAADLKEAMTGSTNNKLSRAAWLGMAAAASLLLVLIVYFFLKPTPYDQLYVEHFSMPEVSQLRNGNDETSFKKMLSDGDCGGVLAYIASLPPEDLTPYYILHEGICQLQFGEIEEARKGFEEIIRSEDTRFIYDAQWYALLAGIRGKDDSYIQARMDEILKQANHPYFQKTKLIKSRL